MIRVYLDQNKWIDLAKAASGRTDGLRYQPVLQAAKDAVRQRRAVFPLSSVHIIETAKSPKLDQRRLLAELMTELSQGFVLRAASCLVREYMPIAVRRCFGEPVKSPFPLHYSRRLEEAFDFNLCQLLGVSERRAEVLRSCFDTPNAWCNLLACHQEAERQAGTKTVNAIGSRMALKNEEWRKVLANDDLDLIQRAYAATLTMSLHELLSHHITASGKSVAEWGALGIDALMRFWRDIPCLHVELELHTQMLREKSKKWDANDTCDIGALSLAIPACDIVVTERFWANVSQKRDLHKTFNTQVVTDLHEVLLHV